MKFPLSPTQDIGLRVKNITGVISGLDDEAYIWSVRVTLDLETPNWNKNIDGTIIDNSISVRVGRQAQSILCMIQVSPTEIAIQAGLESAHDVLAMPTSLMETSLISAAISKVAKTFNVVFPGIYTEVDPE